jgi:hypothetical protein
VQERLRRFGESGHAEEILGPGPAAEADALLNQVTQGDAEADIAALRTVGLLYYQRYLVLPDGPDRPELARAVRVSNRYGLPPRRPCPSWSDACYGHGRVHGRKPRAARRAVAQLGPHRDGQQAADAIMSPAQRPAPGLAG